MNEEVNETTEQQPSKLKSFFDKAKDTGSMSLVYAQYALPHLLLSKLMYFLTQLSLGPKVTPWLIRRYARIYKVDLDEAEYPDLQKYENFNAFFTRALKEDARPIAAEGVVSPVDGVITQLGKVDVGTLIQAKGKNYGLKDLFGDFDFLAQLFKDAVYCTIYLSPAEYHRIHMPMAGQPRDVVYVPGRLFSVNRLSSAHIPHLLTRNERIISLFKSEAGPMAMVMVGALFVGSIETVWDGVVTPGADRSKPQRWQPPEAIRVIPRGKEMGRFNLGSTVVLLFDSRRVEWLPELAPGTHVRMGRRIGTTKKAVQPGAARKPAPKKPA